MAIILRLSLCQISGRCDFIGPAHEEKASLCPALESGLALARSGWEVECCGHDRVTFPNSWPQEILCLLSLSLSLSPAHLPC